MKRRDFLRVSGAAGVALGSVALHAAAAGAAAKPNLVLFLGDDHSTFDTGCYGNTVVRTPDLDRLAAEGMRFDRAFTATAMCAPSRSMLYTGLFPHRNGCHMNHGATRADVKSLPHYLKPLGYRVVLAGKRHIKPSSVYPFEYVSQKQVGDVINGAEPFCLIIASNEPHGPHAHGGYDPDEVPLPPYMVDTPATRRGREGYYTDIDAMDRELGSAMEQLRTSGKEANTLLIYAGDHGAGFMAKWTCYETGLRVPFAARWPGKIRPGTSTAAMVSFVDVLPTFIEAAGGRPPGELDGRSFMGLFAEPSARHRDLIYGAHTNKGIISGRPYPIRSVRGERYKYIRNLAPDGKPTNVVAQNPDPAPGGGGLWAQWNDAGRKGPAAAKQVARAMDRPPEELYDLDNDPWEMSNLADDPGLAAEKRRLGSALDAWMKQQGDRGVEAEAAVAFHASMRGAAKKGKSKK